MSKEEYFRMAEDRSNCLVDWEDGEAIRLTPAHGRHGKFVSRLYGVVDECVTLGKRGDCWTELFVDFGSKTYGVDLAVLFTENLERYRNGRIHGAPDLVVEVVSPDSESRDRVVKFNAFVKFGVPWYWIGDAVAGTLEEYRRTPEGYLRTASGSLDEAFRPQALPGLVIEIQRLMDASSA